MPNARERNDFSVAYFGFESRELLEQFISKYNEFPIYDDKGKEFRLVVQKALFQSMPSKHQV